MAAPTGVAERCGKGTWRDIVGRFGAWSGRGRGITDEGGTTSFRTTREAQSRAAAPNNGEKSPSSLVHKSSQIKSACRERIFASELAGARRWSGCCTTDFLVVTICWDDRGDGWRRRVMQLNEGGKRVQASMAGQENAARGGRFLKLGYKR